MPCYTHYLFAYIFLKHFELFKLIVPSHRSDIDNSFSIILIKINTIRFNIIKLYSKKINISSLKNVTLSESSSKNSISSSANKAVYILLIVLLATNQWRTSFNASRKSSSVLSEVPIFFYLCNILA